MSWRGLVQSTQLNQYEVRMKVEKDFLRYFISGERSFDAAYALWERIYADCHETGIYKIHATVLLSGCIEKMQIPILINKLVALNNHTPITCAWIDYNSSSYVDNLIGEKLPRPELMNIRIFNNEEEASEWLHNQNI